MRSLSFTLCLFFVCACSPRLSDEYQQKYSYLSSIRCLNKSPSGFNGTDPYYLVVLVDAKHLDYSTPGKYFETLSYGLFKRHDPNIGHAWIILCGQDAHGTFLFEGGHTGEFGCIAPKYFDHIVDLSIHKKSENPITYLYTLLPDGQVEIGSGGHHPTFAAAFSLNQEGFFRIKKLIAKEYDFSSWGILGPNCVQFARVCLAATGIQINCEEEIPIPQVFSINGEKIRLWENPAFSCILAQTPELLEKRLLELVQNGQALPATRWYAYRKYKG
jgi:hypothetical protein